MRVFCDVRRILPISRLHASSVCLDLVGGVASAVRFELEGLGGAAQGSGQPLLSVHVLK